MARDSPRREPQKFNCLHGVAVSTNSVNVNRKLGRQMVGLKYCSATMRCDRVVDGDGGPGAPPAELICSLGELSLEQAPANEASAESSAAVGKRPKGNISWVSAEEAVQAEVRLYSHLFTVDSPDDMWEEQVWCAGSACLLVRACPACMLMLSRFKLKDEWNEYRVRLVSCVGGA